MTSPEDRARDSLADLLADVGGTAIPQTCADCRLPIGSTEPHLWLGQSVYHRHCGPGAYVIDPSAIRASIKKEGETSFSGGEE